MSLYPASSCVNVCTFQVEVVTRREYVVLLIRELSLFFKYVNAEDLMR